MIKRWLIRSLTLTILTLCVVAWVGCFWRDTYFGYIGAKKNLDVLLVEGRIDFLLADTGRFAVTGWYWNSHRGTGYRKDWNTTFEIRNETTCPRRRWWGVFIPLWLPTLVSDVTLWFILQKTRPKPPNLRAILGMAAAYYAGWTVQPLVVLIRPWWFSYREAADFLTLADSATFFLLAATVHGLSIFYLIELKNRTLVRHAAIWSSFLSTATVGGGLLLRFVFRDGGVYFILLNILTAPMAAAIVTTSRIRVFRGFPIEPAKPGESKP